MPFRSLLTVTTLLCACGSTDPSNRSAPPAPQFAVEQTTLELPGIGAPLSRTTGPDAAWWGADGWSPVAEAGPTVWPKPVRDIVAPTVPDRAAVLWEDGTLSIGTSPANLQAVDLGALQVKQAHWLQLDADPAYELVVTHRDSDVVRAMESDGTPLWEQRWGADVDHVVHVQGHALRLAHSDGIGLVVRTPGGEVVSRNRPNDSGRVRQVRVVHDVGSFDGPSIALIHQKPAGSAKADLYSPDGAAARGTLRPADLVGSAGTLDLPDGYRVAADHDAEGVVTVRIVQGDQQVFSQILPHPSPTMQLLVLDGSPVVLTQDGARRFVVSPGQAPAVP